MSSNENDFIEYQEPEVDTAINDMITRILSSNPIFEMYNSHIFSEDFENLYMSTLLNTFTEDLIDPIDMILQESMEMQPDSFPKTEHVLEIDSQPFSSIEDSPSKECSICITDYENDDIVSITQCNHVFHTTCIKEWGKYKTDCPICRQDIETK